MGQGVLQIFYDYGWTNDYLVKKNYVSLYICHLKNVVKFEKKKLCYRHKK